MMDVEKRAGDDIIEKLANIEGVYRVRVIK